ncbi:MAG TPA: PilZ domain-containing protein [Rhodocyclaceae bacterium]|nr:PilZ domain-containing protein [Rhodocyclaceae bacterium]
MTTERRQFTRIQFRTNARLRLSDAQADVEVVDLSLKGALVRPKNELLAVIGDEGTLEISLGQSDADIRMEVTIVHRKNDQFGLACREIDLDSITHLRRLVELNIGDESILNRELSALTHLDA